ncbi:MAG TPA: hypothetical protein VJ732_04945 [Bryobacteraceae bacterium]|nr:hypothetical protein [Bryobacteraceae bacterium]
MQRRIQTPFIIWAWAKLHYLGFSAKADVFFGYEMPLDGARQAQATPPVSETAEFLEFSAEYSSASCHLARLWADCPCGLC